MERTRRTPHQQPPRELVACDDEQISRSPLVMLHIGGGRRARIGCLTLGTTSVARHEERGTIRTDANFLGPTIPCAQYRFPDLFVLHCASILLSNGIFSPTGSTSPPHSESQPLSDSHCFAGQSTQPNHVPFFPPLSITEYLFHRTHRIRVAIQGPENVAARQGQ